jgi:phosphoglycerate dehydrogenase-like enzyme
MKKRFAELAENCGIYIDPHNMGATWREIEFLCEQVVRECAEFVDNNTSYDNCGNVEAVTGSELLEHFEINP